MKEIYGVLLGFRIETGEKKTGGQWSKGIATIAEDRSPDERNHHDITVFGERLMEQMSNMKSGSLIRIEFSIESRKWTNQTTGKVSSFMELSANNVNMIEEGDGVALKSTQQQKQAYQQATQPQYSQQAQPQMQYQAPAPKAAEALSKTAEIPDDLPF